MTFRYVDSNRLAAVSLGSGGGGDLKQMIKSAGVNIESEWVPGAPNDALYVKQAEHMMR